MESKLGFSRPVLRVDLIPEYKSALYELGLSDWLIVREKLYTKYADDVIDALVKYKDAYVERVAAEQVWYSILKFEPKDWDLVTRMAYAEVYKTKFKECEAYSILYRWCMRYIPVDQAEYRRREEDWERIGALSA